MKIQLNTDKNIAGDERFEGYLSSLIGNELSRYGDQITRVEIYLSDENAGKKGEDDKRCVLEARIINRPPIAVTSHAKTVDQAVNDALAKLKASIESVFDRLKNH